LEHTADIKFKAFGSTDEEKFSNAAYAMFAAIANTERLKSVKEYEINISAKTIRSLIYDFLNELLFLHETEHFLLKKINEIKISQDKEFYLRALVIGDKINDEEILANIKAVTYNDFQYQKDFVIMVLDI